MFCINALHFDNYDLLLKKNNHSDKKIYFSSGKHYLKSSIEYVIEGQPAYRIVWKKTEEKPPAPKGNRNKNDWLIHIWSAIARVQDGVVWMNRRAYTKPIELTEEEWNALIFLTTQIRNKLTHFIPTTYLLHIDDFKKNGLCILKIIRRLIEESRAIDYPIDDTQKWIDRTGELIDSLNEKLNA